MFPSAQCPVLSALGKWDLASSTPRPARSGEDSPARQRRDIEAIAERNGYRITTWYEDHGLTGTESANRPEFRRLLANAKNRRFEAVCRGKMFLMPCSTGSSSAMPA
ncbi:MAG: recombinase family protein [Pirellula sp.]